ncbi:MAG: zinc metalloprotease HtpX [Methanomassiliicoccales archaeon]|nr:zinc metalloprotease HtpX [Methanomassiliicoccales archaeon]
MGAIARTTGLFAFMFGLFIVIGWVVGTVFIGDWLMGMVFFIILAAAFNLIAYFYSSKIVLFSYRAKIVDERQAPRLYRIVKQVAFKANMPMPKVALVPTDTPNAFATGRNPKNAVVAATEGILKTLSDEELEGVLAHEMAHVKDRDILVMTIAATLAGAISIAARFALFSSLSGGRRDSGAGAIMLIAAITAPLAALLIQLAISRSREYKADEEGAMIIARPLSLARALEKLEAANTKKPLRYGNPASASLWIVNPFSGSGLVRIFSTHPPIAERVKRLRLMAGKMGQF